MAGHSNENAYKENNGPGLANADALLVERKRDLLLGIGVGCASIVQDHVNYPTWALVGPQQFVAFHQAYTARTFLFLIPFAQFFVSLSLLIIWLRHPAISRSLVLFVAVISLVETFVTLRLAIPIHKQLDHVVDRSQVPGLLNELINIDV